MQTQQSTRSDAAQFPTPGVLLPEALGLSDAPVDVPARLAQQAAQLNELRAEAEQLRADRDRLLVQQRQIAELLKSTQPDKLINDLRNVINELQLYKMIADTQA